MPKNPRLAGRYAKSIFDLAIEKGELEKVYEDMILLNAICRKSRDFVGILHSPIIPTDKKEKILERAQEALRQTQFRNQKWYADYKRLRVVAIKEN